METSVATPLEAALGLVVQMEAKRQGVSHKHIQDATGIPDKTFRRYFVKGERHIPLDELELVAGVLGLSVAELMQRAQDELDQQRRARPADGPRVRVVRATKVDAGETTKR